MSAITYLTSIVSALTNRLNLIENNSKKVDELPAQTILEPTSKIPVSRAGNSEYITAQQIISSIQNGNYNKIISIGTITFNSNLLTVEPVIGQINGLIYSTNSNTVISIPLCAIGFNRKDIVVLTTNNTVVVVSGEETNNSVVLAPPVPLDALYLTEFDVSGTTIGIPIDPIIGTQFKKKVESLGYADPTLSGDDKVVQFRPEGSSVYSFSNTSLNSLDGFSLDLIAGNSNAEAPYLGKDIFIFNNKSNNLILKHDGSGASAIKFFFNDNNDVTIPPGGKVWLKYSGNSFELVFKLWSENTGSSLEKQQFTWTTGAQEFTTTNGIAQVLAVFRNGQQINDYTNDTTKVTVTETLNVGNVITVIYSNEIVGANPFYTKAEVDGLIPQIPKIRKEITYFASGDIAQNTVLAGNFVSLLTKAYKIVEMSVLFGEQSMNVNKTIPIQIGTLDTDSVATAVAVQYTANVSAVVGAIQNKMYTFTPNITLPTNKLLTVSTGAFTASTQILKNCLVTLTLEEI